MNKEYTSVEQSKHLLELGLDPETADMEFLFVKKDNSMVGKVPFVKDGYEEPDCGYNIVPCWSPMALLNLMPTYLFKFERGIDLMIYPSLNKSKKWQVSYLSADLSPENKDKYIKVIHGDTLVDAAFGMMCWLLENNFINKGE